MSVELVPLSAVASLMCGSMMMFGLILGTVILKEKIQLIHVISMLVILSGLVVLIVGSYKSLKRENEICSNSLTHETEAALLNNTQETENKNMYFINSEYLRKMQSDVVRYATNDISNETLHGLKVSNLANRRHAGSCNRNIHISNIYELIIGLTVPCLAGLGEAISLIGLKLIQTELESVLVLSFWFTLSGTIVSCIAMLPLEYNRLSFPGNLENSLYLSGHIVTSSLAMVCYVIAMGMLSSHLMSLFNSAQIPVNVFLQYIFFKHLQPMDCGLMEVIGACIVTIGLSIHPVITLIIRPIATVFPKKQCWRTSKDCECEPLVTESIMDDQGLD